MSDLNNIQNKRFKIFKLLLKDIYKLDNNKSHEWWDLREDTNSQIRNMDFKFVKRLFDLNIISENDKAYTLNGSIDDIQLWIKKLILTDILESVIERKQHKIGIAPVKISNMILEDFDLDILNYIYDNNLDAKQYLRRVKVVKIIRKLKN